LSKWEQEQVIIEARIKKRAAKREKLKQFLGQKSITYPTQKIDLLKVPYSHDPEIKQAQTAILIYINKKLQESHNFDLIESRKIRGDLSKDDLNMRSKKFIQAAQELKEANVIAHFSIKNNIFRIRN
jgi:hypothetical protein